MAIKNDEDKIEKIQEKIKQLEARKKDLLARTKGKERKERTRRLIQIGAIIESMGIDSPEIAKSFKDHFSQNESPRTWLEKFISTHKNNV